MKLVEELRNAEKLLSSKNIPDAYLEAELLLRHVLQFDRAHLYINQDMELSRQQIQVYLSLVERRLKGEPSAYIVQNREFYGLDFFVDRRVLIPRPESELLVDKALEFFRHHPEISSPLVADIGTGCGNLAISLALNLTGSKIYGCDISAEALQVAAINCQRHNLSRRVMLLRGYLLEPLPEKVDVIVANLPYVKTEDMAGLDAEVRDFEPEMALSGGVEGLDYVEALLAQAQTKVNKKSAIFLELGAGQGKQAVALARNYFPQSQIILHPDLRGIDRVLSVYQV